MTCKFTLPHWMLVGRSLCRMDVLKGLWRWIPQFKMKVRLLFQAICTEKGDRMVAFRLWLLLRGGRH